jgi:hypothetical protein
VVENRNGSAGLEMDLMPDRMILVAHWPAAGGLGNLQETARTAGQEHW